MKNRVGIVILVLAAVILGIALISVKRESVKDRNEAVIRIDTFSNKWVETSGKLDEEKQNAARLYEDLDKRKQAYTELSNNFTERSEEHTSELQSQSNLVCRLLLEKNKNNTHPIIR